MRAVYSLRARLTLIILLPLVAVTIFVGIWLIQSARITANDLFHRSLLTVALAIANDVSISDGDALSPETLQLLENSSGGPVFYHVYAPDGVIVVGYATPPVGIPFKVEPQPAPQSFDAIYQGRPVSGIRLQTRTQVEGFSGVFTTTVWQDQNVRTRFVLDLLLRTLFALGAVIASVAVIVWYGVRVGLRPLISLENAIARRSSDDLAAIKRAVPEEVSGIVQTLNRLFGQVEATLAAQSQFIANAAHQLRNPIAGVLSLAEAIPNAPTREDMETRARDLLDATHKTSQLTQRLLLHERARALNATHSLRAFDIEAAVREWAHAFRSRIPDGVDFSSDISLEGLSFVGDQVMLREAVTNLYDNVLLHGGPGLSNVSLTADHSRAHIRILLEDDGKGIPRDQIETALTRFAQVGPSEGSGLGLSITREVAEGHGGSLILKPLEKGLRAIILLPRKGSDDHSA